MPPTAVAHSLPDRKRGLRPHHAISARDLVLIGLTWVTCPPYNSLTLGVGVGGVEGWTTVEVEG